MFTFWYLFIGVRKEAATLAASSNSQVACNVAVGEAIPIYTYTVYTRFLDTYWMAGEDNFRLAWLPCRSWIWAVTMQELCQNDWQNGCFFFFPGKFSCLKIVPQTIWDQGPSPSKE